MNDPKKEPEAPKESRITKVDFEMASALAAAAAPIYGSLMRHPDFGDAEARAQALEVAQDLLNDAVKFVKNM